MKPLLCFLAAFELRKDHIINHKPKLSALFNVGFANLMPRLLCDKSIGICYGFRVGVAAKQTWQIMWYRQDIVP